MMNYRTPDHRRLPARRAADAMRASRSCILTTHVNADGDGVGSQIAVAAWMRANGSRAWIVNPTRYPGLFRFLLPDDSWVLDAGSAAAREACAQADLAVVLDTGEVPRIGRVKSMISHLPLVVVDHHPVGDQPLGGISFRDAEASATGEMVYDLLSATRGPWPQEALDAMYVAILTDTGSFRFGNSTPLCHEVVADLIRRGCDPEALYREVYGQSPLRRFRLLEAALSTLTVEEGVGWMVVPPDAFERLEAIGDDLEGLVDYPRSVEGVHVALLFRATPRGVKISLRSDGTVDVNALAREFGGGGHVRASGALIPGDLDDVRERVVAAARAAVRTGLAAG
ncbi:MAG: bifunctional oligoribonuclease/PAP phosphatase NrnA [Gemmatimonadetes bacterium]|nr:bifunctional oligoribonuclease/PAP phosphatase NrnA [Gemmatimonadota bacterium]